MNTAGKVTIFVLATTAIGGIVYAVARALRKPADGPLLGTNPPTTPPTVTSKSTDPAGYNTRLWRSPEVVQRAFGSASAGSLPDVPSVFADLLKRSLGYGRVNVDINGTDPTIQTFQNDWNVVADAVARDLIVRAGQAKPGQIGAPAHIELSSFVGRLDARGQIDRSTLNAAEIAWPLGPGWRTLASLARQVVTDNA